MNCWIYYNIQDFVNIYCINKHSYILFDPDLFLLGI